MKVDNLVRASIFCATAIGMGFSLMLVPNIELITVTVFLSGLTLGSRWGFLVGGLTMIIYSGLNPLGSGLSFPPLFVMQIISMGFNGFFAGLLMPIFFRKEYNIFYLGALFFTGFFVTFIYDMATISSYPLVSGLGLVGIGSALLKGLSFTLLHQLSNAFIFTITVPRFVKLLN